MKNLLLVLAVIIMRISNNLFFDRKYFLFVR